MNITQILRPYRAEMKKYEATLDHILKSDIPLVDKVSKYLILHKGKNLRPFLVIISARLCGPVNDNTFKIAATVELLHSASLIHDDVVDEAELRRGFPSINAVWKNKISVLMGDYLLAKSLIAATETGNLEVMNILSDTAKMLSQGELLQIQNVWRQKNSEKEYYSIIEKKTAALISSCCELGAMSIEPNDEKRSALKEFGKNLGMAFQIKDDLLDYQSRTAIIGKPVGNDLREKKYTLPLIKSLENAPLPEAKQIRKMIARGPEAKQIQRIIEFANKYKGIEFAIEKMQEFKSKAIQNLEIFPQNEYKSVVIDLLEFVISREK